MWEVYRQLLVAERFDGIEVGGARCGNQGFDGARLEMVTELSVGLDTQAEWSWFQRAYQSRGCVALNTGELAAWVHHP